jgi:hypothetical protein
MEHIGNSLKGIYRDILKRADNTVIFDSGWQSNIIVNRCRTLLSAFMRNEKTRGICSLKVGKGSAAWDTAGTPAPDATITGLTDTSPYIVDESNLKLEYLDENDQVVPGPTSRLQVSVTLGQDQPPAVPPLSSYPMREFGLFGEYTDTLGTVHEYMIDCIRHSVINKDVTATLERTVKLYF